MQLNPTLAVIIATTGRTDAVKQTVSNLQKQKRIPDRVIVVGADISDIAGVSSNAFDLDLKIAPKGSCSQRNHALEALTSDIDIVTFLDDDFVPDERYLEETVRLFEKAPEIIGVTGELKADGIDGPGLSFYDAEQLLNIISSEPGETLRNRQALYGCNMSLRTSVIVDRRFDENLPLYGWLEDIDFTHPLTRSGRLVSSNRITGVHLGLKKGRSPGRRVGYSQVANVFYLWRKKTMQPKLGGRLLRQQLLSNLFRSFRPEPWIDRRGRLIGNLMALGDLARGRVNPRRIETI